MDTSRRIAIPGNQKGFTLVFLAVIIVVICGFLGLALDVGYMYIAKGQLQNTADSAALAGAAKLNGTVSFTTQTSARAEAIKFAAQNIAAGSTVTISSNSGKNTLSADNDISVGNWDPKTHPGTPFDETRTPINAVQVRARRTGSADAAGLSAGGRVDLFFGKFLETFNLGPSAMGTLATAIAHRAPRAGFYFLISQNVCNSISFPVTLSPAPGTDNMAWSSLLQPSTNSNDLNDLFMCPADRLPNEDVCGSLLYTTGGTVGATFKAAEIDFYDPGYDAANKTFSVDHKGDSYVSTWTVVVPVTTAANPSAQASPLPVYGYARIKMMRICGSGAGNVCNSSSGRLYTAPKEICPGGVDEITINEISCVTCANSNNLLGSKPNLVR